MKKEREFNSSNMIAIIIGVLIIFVGIALIGDLPPIKDWERFQELITSYGSNASIVLGGAMSMIGAMIIFVGLKTNK